MASTEPNMLEAAFIAQAKIMERSRRGKKHAAQSGSLNVMFGAPFGYRYVSVREGGGQSRFEPALHSVFRSCRRRCTQKRRNRPTVVSMRCTTRCIGKTYWSMPTNAAKPTAELREWTTRPSRTSKRTAGNDGWTN